MDYPKLRSAVLEGFYRLAAWGLITGILAGFAWLLTWLVHNAKQ